MLKGGFLKTRRRYADLSDEDSVSFAASRAKQHSAAQRGEALESSRSRLNSIFRRLKPSTSGVGALGGKSDPSVDPEGGVGGGAVASPATGGREPSAKPKRQFPHGFASIAALISGPATQKLSAGADDEQPSAPSVPSRQQPHVADRTIPSPSPGDAGYRGSSNEPSPELLPASIKWKRCQVDVDKHPPINQTRISEDSATITPKNWRPPASPKIPIVEAPLSPPPLLTFREPNERGASLPLPVTNEEAVEVSAAAVAHDIIDDTTTTTTSIEGEVNAIGSSEDTDSRSLSRKRQVAVGKATREYQIYIEQVPKVDRRPWQPQTPNWKQTASNRVWLDELMTWRRNLHREASRREKGAGGRKTKRGKKQQEQDAMQVPFFPSLLGQKHNHQKGKEEQQTAIAKGPIPHRKGRRLVPTAVSEVSALG